MGSTYRGIIRQHTSEVPGQILSFCASLWLKIGRGKIRPLLPEVSYEKSHYPDPDPRFVLFFRVAAACPGPNYPAGAAATLAGRTRQAESRTRKECLSPARPGD